MSPFERSILVFAIGLAGCGIASIRERAAGDFQCSADSIKIERLSGMVEKVDGCGKSDVYGWHWEQDRWFSVLERASFELSCEKTELKVTILGPRQVGVSGCNTKRVYVFTDAGWLLDSGADQTAPAAPAAPAKTSDPEAPPAEPAAPEDPGTF